MTILTFCAYFEPEIAASMYLTTNLFEDAANAGATIEMFVPTPTRGVDKDTVLKYKKVKYEERCGGKWRIHRFAMIQEGKGTIGRALRYVLLNLAFVFKGLLTKADVMFIDSTPPTQGFMAAFLKKCKNIPIVYNLQDIFPDSLVNTGISTKKSLLFRVGRWMENITYRNADAIIAISDDFKRNIMRKGVPEDKIVVVPNWPDIENICAVERRNNVIFDRYGLDRNKFYISYSGNIGYTQNMDLLLDTAKKIKNELKNVRFVLIGDGAAKVDVERRIKDEAIDNVILLPLQPYEDIAHVFSLGNVGLIISKPGVGANSVPSKTWGYMAAGVSVLSSFDLDSDLVRIVQKCDCGDCVTPDDLDEFVQMISKISSTDQNLLSEKGQNGRRYIEENLSRKACTKRYIETIDNVYKRGCIQLEE